MIIDIRDRICNKMICFLLKRCGLFQTTFYRCCEKFPPATVFALAKEYYDYKERRSK